MPISRPDPTNPPLDRNRVAMIRCNSGAERETEREREREIDRKGPHHLHTSTFCWETRIDEKREAPYFFLFFFFVTIPESIHQKEDVGKIKKLDGRRPGHYFK